MVLGCCSCYKKTHFIHFTHALGCYSCYKKTDFTDSLTMVLGCCSCYKKTHFLRLCTYGAWLLQLLQENTSYSLFSYGAWLLQLLQEKIFIESVPMVLGCWSCYKKRDLLNFYPWCLVAVVATRKHIF